MFGSQLKSRKPAESNGLMGLTSCRDNASRLRGHACPSGSCCSQGSASEPYGHAHRPALPKPQPRREIPRPTGRNRPPRDNARMMSSPQRMPLSNRAGTRPAIRSAIGGNALMDAGAASNCRPPWLETTMPSAPASDERIPLMTRLPTICALSAMSAASKYVSNVQNRGSPWHSFAR